MQHVLQHVPKTCPEIQKVQQCIVSIDILYLYSKNRLNITTSDAIQIRLEDGPAEHVVEILEVRADQSYESTDAIDKRAVWHTFAILLYY